MYVTQLVELILVIVLLPVVGVLLKQRFDALDKQVAELQTTANANNVSIGRLIESQKNVVTNQTLQSAAQVRLIGEMDDLEDVNNQLQTATDILRRKMESHDEMHARLAEDLSERQS